MLAKFALIVMLVIPVVYLGFSLLNILMDEVLKKKGGDGK